MSDCVRACVRACVRVRVSVCVSFAPSTWEKKYHRAVTSHKKDTMLFVAYVFGWYLVEHGISTHAQPPTHAHPHTTTHTHTRTPHTPTSINRTTETTVGRGIWQRHIGFVYRNISYLPPATSISESPVPLLSHLRQPSTASWLQIQLRRSSVLSSGQLCCFAVFERENRPTIKSFFMEVAKAFAAKKEIMSMRTPY